MIHTQLNGEKKNMQHMIIPNFDSMWLCKSKKTSLQKKEIAGGI